MYAAGGGHTDVVQVLLSQQDVDINMRDKVCPSQWKWTLNITQLKPHHFSTCVNCKLYYNNIIIYSKFRVAGLQLIGQKVEDIFKFAK